MGVFVPEQSKRQTARDRIPSAGAEGGDMGRCKFIDRFQLIGARAWVTGKGIADRPGLVVCSLERTHDSDSTPAIVSSILTLAKSESLIRSRPELSRVIRVRLDLETTPDVSGLLRLRTTLDDSGLLRMTLENY